MVKTCAVFTESGTSTSFVYELRIPFRRFVRVVGSLFDRVESIDDRTNIPSVYKQDRITKSTETV